MEDDKRGRESSELRWREEREREVELVRVWNERL